MPETDPEMTSTPVPPWLSQKVWLAVLGITALVVLAGLGRVELHAEHIVVIVSALIGGQALEGAAANWWRRPPS